MSLTTADGRELLVNGDFNSGAKRWPFVTDQDLAWHVHQQLFEMYFAQGFLSLAVFLVLLLAVARGLWPAFWAGDSYAGAMGAALSAFLTVGLLGSTMDTARVAMLFSLGSLFAVLGTPGTKHEKP